MDGKPEEQKEALLKEIKTQTDEQLKSIKDDLAKSVQDVKVGLISKEDFDKEFEAIKGKLEAYDSEKFAKFEKALEDMTEVAKKQGEELAKMKDQGNPGESPKAKFQKEIKKALESDEFKNYAENNGKGKVSFDLKQVSITDDYTGTSRVHITNRDPRVVDHPKVMRMNIRDLMTVTPIDLPFLAFIEVYDWERNVGTNSENGVLAESAFKLREAVSEVKRIGTHVNLSKRMLRSVPFVMSHLTTRLPEQVKYYEDFQFLFGDGQGNNLLGLFEQSRDFTTIINTSITGNAGAVASVASYDGGTKALVTLTDAQNDLRNGDVITIANATASAYNAAHNVILISPTQFVIEVTYAAEATSAWTFVVNNAFKDTIDNAQEIDVLKVANALVTQLEYSASGIVLNPVDATKLELIKGSDEHYVDLQRTNEGLMLISGIPVVQTTAMPAGKFMVGDFQMAAAVMQFTDLVLEFSESTQEKLRNTVEAIIYEEIIFPIYNRFMFVTGQFSTAKTAIGV